MPDCTVIDALTPCEFVMPAVEETAPDPMTFERAPSVVDVTLKDAMHVVGDEPTVRSERLENAIVCPVIAELGAGCPDCWHPVNVTFGGVANESPAGNVSAYATPFAVVCVKPLTGETVKPMFVVACEPD
jgi:hypothetical protein